jgi:glycosyltransferase involved in cell wall biosynthesis
MNPSSVSVAISTYNSSDYLKACLANLAEQQETIICELIVIDSGSSQDESSVCRDWRGNFAQLIYERTHQETLYSAWNRALAKASGKYFINANTDDSLHPGALQMLAKAMDNHPGAALAYGDWMWATVPNATYPWDSSFRRCMHSEYHPTLPLFYAYAGCHQFWRTDKLRELGGFNATYKAAGDYDALCRMAMKRWHAVYVPEAISAFYQNPNGLSRSSGTSHREFLEIRDRFRNQIAIDHLYDVDPADAAVCARAWVDLGHRALSLFVPWAERPTPDTEFAAACARRALDLDSSNRAARQLLRASGHRPSDLLSRLRGLVAQAGARVAK